MHIHFWRTNRVMFRLLFDPPIRRSRLYLDRRKRSLDNHEMWKRSRREYQLLGDDKHSDCESLE
jgi:hypothetical protein